jgi:hypothetical protein
MSHLEIHVNGHQPFAGPLTGDELRVSVSHWVCVFDILKDDNGARVHAVLEKTLLASGC